MVDVPALAGAVHLSVTSASPASALSDGAPGTSSSSVMVTVIPAPSDTSLAESPLAASRISNVSSSSSTSSSVMVSVRSSEASQWVPAATSAKSATAKVTVSLKLSKSSPAVAVPFAVETVTATPASGTVALVVLCRHRHGHGPAVLGDRRGGVDVNRHPNRARLARHAGGLRGGAVTVGGGDCAQLERVRRPVGEPHDPVARAVHAARAAVGDFCPVGSSCRLRRCCGGIRSCR